MNPGTNACDLTEQNASRLNCALVEQTSLATLGIQPVLGRNFLPEEDRPNVPRIAVLSYSLWRSRFGGDPGVLDKTISLDGAATRIVRVLPANFEMPTLSPIDLLLPLGLDEERQRRANPGAVLRTFARLKPGFDVPRAVAALQPWLEQALQGAPPMFRKEIRLSVRTLRDRQTQDVRLASWLFLGAVCAFLLVACTNVANLLLARASGRQRETAVRAALGASKGRLIRQNLTESLLLGRLWNLGNVHLGMQTENILVENVPLVQYRYATPEKKVAFFAELESRINRLPGMMAVAMSDSLPPFGRMRSTIFAAIEVAGRPLFNEGSGGVVEWRAITRGYFSAVGIRIVQGRGFQQSDLLRPENSIILNEILARQLFPNANPIGQRVRWGRTQGPWRTVVGVVADVKNDGLASKAGPEFYLPSLKSDEMLSEGYVVVRTQMNPKTVANCMRAETSGLDSTVPVTIEAMSQRVSKFTARPRFDAMLLSLFAGMGVLLAAIGIYGVVRYLVEQRTREIGVRMALGATPQSILKIVLAKVVQWTIVGSALGLFGAWACARLLQSLLFEVRPRDPVLFGLAWLLLVAVVFMAAWIPARRAMRVDPIVALRYE